MGALMAFIQGNWIPIAVCMACFVIGYLDGVRDTDSKWHKKIAEEATAKNPNVQA